MDQTPAFKYAIKLLSIKDFPKTKIQTKLTDKGFESNDIEKAIEKLEELKYINDEEYSRSRVRALLRKNYGDQYISFKLKQEKIFLKDTTILEERERLQITSGMQIKNLLYKKFQIENRDELTHEQKIKFQRYLITRGFSYAH